MICPVASLDILRAAAADLNFICLYFFKNCFIFNQRRVALSLEGCSVIEDGILLSSVLNVQKKVEVLDSKTNTTNSYPSICKAAAALNVDVKSLNRHCLAKADLGLKILYKDRYLIRVSDESKILNSTALTKKRLSGVKLDLLEKGKVYFFDAQARDKKTIAYVFNSCWEAARELTPKRCVHLTDDELKRNKNLQHIRRVINKVVLTTTEKGKFFVFQNPGYSECLSLVVFGENLYSTVGEKQISIQERGMVKLPYLQLGVLVGLLLSDGSFGISKRSVNYYFTITQSLVKSSYLWFVFSLLSHYCSSCPYLDIGSRNGTKTFALVFYTRSYPFITELRNKFYHERAANNGFKSIPLDIYELLSPPALAHLIMGDGSRKEYGLEICTDCYSLSDVVRLSNVLIIRYQLNCTIRLKRENQYRIYITSKSLTKLRTIVYPYMHLSMMYKL